MPELEHNAELKGGMIKIVNLTDLQAVLLNDLLCSTEREINMFEDHMCTVEECEKSEKCHRFMAKPKEIGQAFFIDNDHDENGCEYFMPATENDYERRNTTRRYTPQT